MFWRWAAVAWLILVMVIIFCADRRLLQPLFLYVNNHSGLDKLGHFVLIGGMALFLNLALGLRETRWLGRRWLLGSLIVGVVCVFEEISQFWFPSRSFDLLDLASDFAGILFFGWLARMVFRRNAQV